jgi:hypothetical protein
MPLPASVRIISLATFALGIAVLATTIGLRIASPWPLEWMEGASLQHALRLLHGQSIYGPPTSEFIPFLYPPLAYAPVALGAWLFGPSLWVGRVISVLALAGSLACVFATVRRTTDSAAIGCWATGTFALGFGYTGAFGDLVRVDSVFMLLVLLGIERLSARSIATGLIWLVLSCFAKQHGVLFLGAAGAGLLVSEGQTARRQLMAAVGALLAGTGALQAGSSGYFLKYTGSVPAGHGIVPHLLMSYVGVDVGMYLPVLALFAMVATSRRLDWAERLGGGSSALGYLLVVAGLAASALGRAHPGGDDNVRMPGFAVLVLAAATAIPALRKAAPGKASRVLVCIALALQPLLLLQLPAAHAPPARTTAQFQSLKAALTRCASGDIANAVALDHALLTGRPFLHTMALSDIRLSDDPKLIAAATQALLDGLTAPNAPTSIAISSTFPELTEVLQRNYVVCERLPPLQLATGYALEATTVYTKR